MGGGGGVLTGRVRCMEYNFLWYCLNKSCVDDTKQGLIYINNFHNFIYRIMFCFCFLSTPIIWYKRFIFSFFFFILGQNKLKLGNKVVLYMYIILVDFIYWIRIKIQIRIQIKIRIQILHLDSDLDPESDPRGCKDG